MTKRIRRRGAMPWFKFYGKEFRSNPVLSRMPVAHQYAYVILLCLASDSQQRGSILLDDEDIAAEVKMDREDWLTLKAKFKAKGLIDFTNEGVTLLLWDAEQNTQYKYPSTRPDAVRERVAKSRAKKKAAKEMAQKSLVTPSLPSLASAHVTSATKKAANNENTLPEGVSAIRRPQKVKRISLVTHSLHPPISADATSVTSDVTNPGNAFPRTVSDEGTRYSATSVTSDFGGCNEYVTSGNDKKREVTTSETPATKELQTGVTTQERDIDINLDLDPYLIKKENTNKEGSTNVDLSASASLSEQVDCEPAIACNAPEVEEIPVAEIPDFEPLTLPLIFEPEIETGGVASIENITEPNRTASRKGVTLSEAVEILKTVYNEFKPQNWAVCQNISPKRQANLKQVIVTCGGLTAEGLEKARVLMESAMLHAKQNKFWGQQQSGSKFDFDCLFRDNRIYSFSERWLDSQNSLEEATPYETDISRAIKENLARRLAEIELEERESGVASDFSGYGATFQSPVACQSPVEPQMRSAEVPDGDYVDSDFDEVGW